MNSLLYFNFLSGRNRRLIDTGTCGCGGAHRCFCVLQTGSSMADDLDIEAMLEAPYRKVSPHVASLVWCEELAGLCCSQVRFKFGSTQMPNACAKSF